MGNPLLDALQVRYRNQANAVRTRLAQAEQGVHARQDVTAGQKREMVNSVRAQAHQRLRDLAANLQRDQQATIARLRRSIYKLPPKAAMHLDWRNALDRAERIADQHDPRDPNRALQLALREFDRAELVEDGAMMRALLLVAEQRGWTAIAHRFAQAEPTAGAAMAEMADIADQLADRVQQYATSSMFELPPPQPPPGPPSLAVALDEQASSEPAATP